VTVVVAAGVLRLWLEQPGERRALVQVRIDDLDDRTAARRSRLDFDECHQTPPIDEIDLLTGLQAHVGLLPVLAAAHDTTELLLLALDVGHLDRLDGDLEQQLDSALDFRLGRVGDDAKDHLVNTCLPR
jgi:hypothetical protein